MKNCYPFFIVLLTLFACQDIRPEQRTATGDDSMAQFAGDTNFKEIHEKPVKFDFQGIGEMITFPTPDGASGSAYTVMSDSPTDDYLIVIHEWWGLNDYIKSEAEKYAKALGGVHVMALDLYDGQTADNADDAEKIMQSVTDERAKSIIQGALNKAGSDANIASIGWCFGGGWSLRAAIMAGDRAAGCVMYYGMPVLKAKALAPIQCDILGIFARQDDWITAEVINNFVDLAKATDTELEVHVFDAKHAFANPSSPRYNEDAAQGANALAMDFLKKCFE